MKTTTLALCGAMCFSISSGAMANEPAQPEGGDQVWDNQWRTKESAFLSGHVQLTSEKDFIKAGESYFSPDGRMVIFQAIPVPADGQEPDKYYSMYVATVVRDDDGNITGLGPAGRVSAPGSSNTCGWFHPTEPMRILFGSTRVAPSEEAVAGYQRSNSKYSWQFPVEMEILSGTLKMKYELSSEAKERAAEHKSEGDSTPPKLSMDDIVSVPTLEDAEPIWERAGYDAEGSWSPDGRFILYTQLEPGGTNGDIWVYDSSDGTHTPLVTNDGYDGGPFFSPDGGSICYRSDRHGDNLLQVFVSTLAFDEQGKITGIEQELALTDNEHVNWCPFYTPDGKYLFYASSQISHGNYEVFAIDAKGSFEPDATAHLRITDARGFDGLPAFTRDGEWMIWTAQRGEIQEGADRPSSQLWAARVDLEAVDQAYQRAQHEITGDE